MKFSELFSKTQKAAPADETSSSARLLSKGGFVYKEMAGAYNLLPLGLRVVEKIKAIVREEMNQLGGQELLMTSLQRKELWQKTDRWDDKKVDVWFKSNLKSGAEVGLGWSHEEPIADMMKTFIASYRDLPLSVYQFQTKLRNELRAKSGILRTREFIMKDMYSFSRSDKEHQAFYDQATKAYLRVFERVGLGDRTYLTFASGEPFTEFSHEFQTVTPAGEDTVYLHRGKKLAINKEVMKDSVLKKMGLARRDLEEVKASEVGNIFSFGTKKSEQLGLIFTDEKGKSQPVVLGSYGIGVTRLMGTIVEVFHDAKGIIWPKSVAPSQMHLLGLGDNQKVKKAADKIYEDLTKAGVEVLYDDRVESAGVKLSDADLIGIPTRIVVSEKTLARNSAELKPRSALEPKLVSLSEAVDALQ